MEESNLVPSPQQEAAQPEFAAPPPAPPAYGIFLNADGLRAGWSFLVYLAMGVAIAYLLAAGLRLWHPAAGPGRLWKGMFAEAGLFLAAAIPALVMARIEKRPFGVYGLPARSAFGRAFWAGAIWGLVALTVLILAMRTVHVFYFGGISLHGVRVLKFAAYWALFFVLVGLFEEFLLRGYTQFSLTRGLGFWPTAVLLSAAFGTIHLGNQGESWIGALGAALIGFFFCLTLRRTGNLWFAVGFHASWDWGETFLYSVPNSGTTAPGHLINSSFHGSAWLSGGTVGPEGSVLCVALIVLLWVVFDRRYREVKYEA
jgi:hypothetical protein